MNYSLCTSCHLPVLLPASHCPQCHAVLDAIPRDGTQLIGAVIEGYYRFEQFLGQGSMAWVYRGTHLEVGSSVAIKLLKPVVAADPALVERFRKEAAAVSLLSHPHILAVLNSGQTPSGLHYMVTEYIHGRTLATIIHEEKKLPLKRATDIVQQILEALEEAHSKGVVHRDLKPENIMVMALRGGGDFCKIVDFGIALRRLPDEKRLTRHGEIVGTPEFMAPEVIRGQETTAQADLYAVGLMYYEMLTGELPFPKGSMIETLMSRIQRDPVPIRSKLPSVPIRVENILKRALEKEPANRFANASEFLEALQSGHSITTHLCVSCLQPVHSNQKFCPHCGRLQEESAAAVLPEMNTLPRAFAVPFWGRETELEILKQFIVSDAVFLEVIGEAGVGRRALVQQAAVLFTAQHGYHIADLCPDNPAARAWYPWRRLFTRKLGFSSTPRRSLVEDTCRRFGLDTEDIPHILMLFGVLEEFDLEPFVRRREMIMSVARLALAIFAKEPTIVVCRNADSLDEPSRDVLLYLARLPQPKQFHVICTSTKPWLSLVLPKEYVQMLEVKRFSELESKTFCQDVLQCNGTFADATVVRHLVNVAGGLPLHLVEGLRLLHEGISEPDKGLSDIIQLRVRNMQGAARRFLQWLAAAGGRLPLHFVRDSGLFEKEVLDSITMCILHGFTLSTPDDDVIMAHDLYNRVMLAETPAAVRIQLHQKLFDRIRHHFDDPRLLCPHALHVRNQEVAASYYERAGALCREDFDLSGALVHYRKAYELTEFSARQGHNLQQFRQICVAYGELLHEVGKTEDALRVFQEGQLGCEQTNDMECLQLQMGFATAAANLFGERAQFVATRVAEKLLALPPQNTWNDLLQLVKLALSKKWFSLGLTWIERWEQVLSRSPEGRFNYWERDWAKMRCLIGRGNIGAAIAIGEQILKTMEGKSHWRAAARINEELVRCHMIDSDFTKAQMRLQTHIAALRFLGDRQALVETQLRLASLDAENRVSWAQEALTLARKIGFIEGITHAHKLLQ